MTIPPSLTEIESSFQLEPVKLNAPSAVLLLLLTTALAYVTADHLVSSLTDFTLSHPSISREWLTLIVVPIISNAAEHTTAVIVARKGKFDLAMSVAVGSCIQIALFVIPVLVLVAWGMGKPLTLLFDPLETLVSTSILSW
jgi:Ca2+:H+ antiporter